MLLNHSVQSKRISNTIPPPAYMFDENHCSCPLLIADSQVRNGCLLPVNKLRTSRDNWNRQPSRSAKHLNNLLHRMPEVLQDIPEFLDSWRDSVSGMLEPAPDIVLQAALSAI